ncbi:MAG: hypothetical protein AAF493_15925 [Pseudomonadota bacterium]
MMDTNPRFEYRLQTSDDPTTLPRILLQLSRRRIVPDYLEHRRGPGRQHSLLVFEITVDAQTAGIIARQLERTVEVNVVEYSRAIPQPRILAKVS